jgi:hypothetical protein
LLCFRPKKYPNPPGLVLSEFIPDSLSENNQNPVPSAV